MDTLTDSPQAPAPATRSPCNVTLPALPADRQCTLLAGHDGDHSDGRATFTTDRALHLHGLIAAAHDTIVAQAPQLARDAVLKGSVSMQVRGLENRKSRRAEKAAKPRDARSRR